MSDKKIYKVGMLVINPDTYIDINGNIRGTLPEIWNYIKRELTDKYSFEEKIISNITNFSELQNKVNNEFDILIAPYWILQERMKISDFTETILYNSPSIIYDKDVENDLYNYGFIKSIFKVWFYPILLVIILIIIVSVINNIIKYNNNFYDSFTMTIELFLSSKNAFIQSNYAKFNSYITFMFVIVFLVMLFILSYTVRETSNIKSNYRLINHTIKGKGIYVRKGDNGGVNRIKKYGGIPIEVNDPVTSYNLNKYKKNINGFAFDTLDINPLLSSGKGEFGVSEVISKWIPVGFPINKKHSKLKQDIDKVILKLRIKGKIHYSCQKIYNKSLLC